MARVLKWIINRERAIYSGENEPKTERISGTINGERIRLQPDATIRNWEKNFS